MLSSEESVYLHALAERDGALVVTGSYHGPLDVSESDPQLSYQQDSDRFVVAYDAQDTLELAVAVEQKIGSLALPWQQDIAFAPSGEIIFGATVLSTFGYGGEQLVANASRDVALLSIAPDGQLDWLRHFGNDQIQEIWGMVVHGSELIVVGEFSGGLDLGGDLLLYEGLTDVFVAKFAL